MIASNPEAGNEIAGTGGARKVRVAGRGKGKSGGYRVITFYSGKDVPVFLMAVYSKGGKATLTKAERNELESLSQPRSRNVQTGRAPICLSWGKG